MSRIVLFVAIFVVVDALGADRTPAPLSPDAAVASMKVPDGFQVTLVAAEPDVVQPVSFCFDARGRLFVAEALNYGEWQPSGRDRIVILEDRDGDGRTESRKVFYEGFNYVTGIEIGFGGVWVMSPPNLYFLPDRNGDDRIDGPPEILFDGFGYRESRHNLANGFTWGPDGWLYAGHGRTSPSDVGRPGTPAEKRIHCDGGVYRIHPTRLVFENFADGTTNPWGVDFDDFGQCFVSNCVNPHLFHVIQGAHYEPWRNRPSSLYAYDRIATIADHLHYPTDQPKAMRGETAETLAMGGGHAHCGTLVYLADSFPANYRNSVFMCNVHGRRINNDLLRRRGSGYTASHGPDFMISGDPWFMGVTLRTGPDGSIFVSDWSDTGECHTYKPERGTGRIYKISYGAPKPSVIDLTTASTDELVELQKHPNDWYVRHARRLLQERANEANWNGDRLHAALRRDLDEEPNVPRRLRALWALHVTGGISQQELLGLLEDSAEHIRAWAIQLLCESPPLPSSVLSSLAKIAETDPSPLVRLYLAAALQRLPLSDRSAIAAGLVVHSEDADDPNLPLMIWYGMEPLVANDVAGMLELAARAEVPIVRRFIARRFAEFATTDSVAKSQLQSFAQVLATANDPVACDLLAGFREGARGRKNLPSPPGWSNTYKRLMTSSDANVRDLATIVAVAFGDQAALEHLRRNALNEELSTEDRVTAIEILVEKGLADVATMLHGLLDDPSVRTAAIRGLAAIPHPQTPDRLLALYPRLSPSEKQEAIATLSSRREFAAVLLNALEAEKISPVDLTAYSARQLNSLQDPELRDRLRKVWGDVRDTLPQKKELIARFQRQLTETALKGADLENGRRLYAKTCQPCHVLFGQGTKIGPDLTGSNRRNLEYILSNIVDPSAEIGRDYRLSVITTNDGRVLTGIVLEKTPARLTIQTATEKLILALNDIDEISESPVSMMPEGQLEHLSRDEVRDLIAYLMSR